MAGNIKGITIEIGGDTKGLDKALKSTNKYIFDTQKELREVERLLKLDPKNTELLAQKQKLLSGQVTTTKNKLEALKDAKARCDEAMKNGTEINEAMYRKLQREISITETNLKRLEIENNRFIQDTKKTGEALTSIGKKGLALSGVILGAGTASAIMASNFDDNMANINTLLDDESHLESYKEKVKEVSNQMNIDLGVVSDGMYQAISSIGDGGEETQKIFETMSLSAKAGSAEVSDSVSLISAGMKAYGQVNDETAQKISDLAFNTAKLGVTTFPEMAKSMQPLFPLANSLNMSLEELFGIMATGTGVTGNTAEVSTQLKAILSGLMKPTADMTKLIDKYGYSNAQAMIEAESFSGVLKILQKETGGQSDKLASLFGSTEALTLATALTGEQFDNFIDKTKAMGDATGTTETAYNKLQTSGEKVRSAFNALKNSGVELGSAIMDILAPILQSLAEKIKGLVQWFSGLSDGQKKIIVVLAGVAAIIPPLLILIGSIASGIAAITTAVGAMNLAFLANPITWIIAGIVAGVAVLVAAIIGLWNNCEWFRTGVTKIFTSIQNAWNALVNALKAIWQNENVQAVWEGTWMTIQLVFQQVMDAIKTTFDFWAKIFSGDFQGAFDVVKEYFFRTWERIESYFSSWWEAFQTIFTNCFNGTISFFENNWQNILIYIMNPFAGIVSFLYTLNPQFKEWVDNVIGEFKSWFNGVIDIGKNIVSGIWEGISSSWAWICEKITGWCGNLVNYVKSVLGIHSPSRIFRDEVGKMIVEGVEVGIREEGVQLKEEMEKMLKDLDLQRELGVISDAEYYRKLEYYRDEYFTKGTEGWWKYTQKIIDFENKQLEEQEKILKKQKDDAIQAFKDIASQAEASAKEVADAQSNFSNKLVGFGSLYEMTTETIVGGAKDGGDIVIKRAKLTNLKDNIKILNEYTSSLKAIKDRGIPKGFFQMLRDMGIEEGTAFAKALLATPEEELATYMADWQYIQDESDRASKMIYEDEAAQTAQKTRNAINEWIEELPEDWKQNGQLTVAAFGEGIFDELKRIKEQIKTAFDELFPKTTAPTIAFAANVSGKPTSTIERQQGDIVFNNNFYGDNVSPSDINRAQRQNAKQAALI